MAIIFLYKKNEYKMNIENNKSINGILTTFLSIINENESNIIFLYNGKKLSFKFENLLNKLNNNNLIISVFNIKNDKKNNDKFKYIICQKCYNLSFLNINNNYNNISLGNCINNHNFDNILIHEFIKNKNSIECCICKNNKKLYNNNFYICSCGKPICKLCLNSHKIENHNIIEYDQRYKICNNHEKEFISYCIDCKMNLCEECAEKHYKHKIIMYKMVINKIKKEMKNKLYDNKKKINEFIEQIDKLNEIYNNFTINLKNDLEDYTNLINNILYCLDNLNNYETIMNVINFKFEILNNDINHFLNKNIKNKFIYIIDLFERDTNEMDILYEIENSDNKINILGSKFIEKNKKKINIIINNKILELKEEYKTNKKDKIMKIKVKLLVNKILTDMSNMFDGCSNLLSLSDISKWNTNNIINMSYMFNKCSKLSSIHDISKWNTNNVTDMSRMFYGCSNLLSLPDISKWNTNNVNDMSEMFDLCSNLSSLPDISKWNINNVFDMNGMFAGCSNLLLLPDISKWNINNITNTKGMFDRCLTLSSLPDISNNIAIFYAK